MEVIKDELKAISGGMLPVAVIEGGLVAAGLFVAPTEIASAFGYTGGYPALGQATGESLFDLIHSDPLGQMQFDASDFGRSYIVSAFPNEFPHA